MTPLPTRHVLVNNTVMNGHPPGTILATPCTTTTPCIDPLSAGILVKRGFVTWVNPTGEPAAETELPVWPDSVSADITQRVGTSGCAPCAAKRAAATAAR